VLQGYISRRLPPSSNVSTNSGATAQGRCKDGVSNPLTRRRIFGDGVTARLNRLTGLASTRWLPRWSGISA